MSQEQTNEAQQQEPIDPRRIWTIPARNETLCKLQEVQARIDRAMLSIRMDEQEMKELVWSLRREFEVTGLDLVDINKGLIVLAEAPEDLTNADGYYNGVEQ